MHLCALCASTDVNECSADADACGQGHCVNVIGSFECQCATGYRVGQHGRCEGD